MGEVRLMLVYGPGGAGKTALMLRAGEVLARRLDGRLLHHTCRARENLATIASALVDELPPPRAGAGRDPLRALARAAAETPIVLCIDDAQHAETNALVDGLVRLCVRRLPLWFCVASRVALPITPTAVDHLVLPLRGLSLDDARALWGALEQLYGPPGVAFDEVWPRSGGSPLALKRAFVGPLAPVENDHSELASLGWLDRALLRELCAYRRPVPIEALAADRDRRAVEGSLRRLARRFLVELSPGGLVAMHDLVRDRVCAALPPTPEAHARCLAHYARAPRSQTAFVERLHHAVAAGAREVVDAILWEQASPLQRAAPADAVLDHELAAALDHTAATRALPIELTLLRARLHARSGEVARATAELAALSPSEHPLVALEQGELAYFRGALLEAAATLDHAVGDERLLVPARVWAALIAVEARRHLGRYDEARAVAARAAPVFAAFGPFGEGPRQFLDALALRDHERYREAIAVLAVCRRLRDEASRVTIPFELPIPIEPLMARVGAALDLAEATVRAALGVPFDDEPVGDPDAFVHDSAYYRHVARLLVAEVNVLTGDGRAALAAAEQVMRESLEMVTLDRWAAWLWGQAALLLGQIGDVETQLAPRLRAATETEHRWATVRLTDVLARAALAAGELERAEALAAPLVETASDGTAARMAAIVDRARALLGRARPRVRPMDPEGHDAATARLDRLERALLEGRVAAARREASALLVECERCGWRELACRARLLVAETLRDDDWVTASSELARARAAAEANGWRADSVRAGLLGAALARQTGDREGARALLVATEALAREVGLRVEADAAALALLHAEPGGGGDTPAGRMARRFDLVEPIACVVRGTDGERCLVARQAALLDERRFELLVDLRRGTVRCGRRVADLSRRASLLELMNALASPPGQPVAIEVLAKRTWGVDYHPLRHRGRVAMALSRLRRLVGEDAIVSAPEGYLLRVTGPWAVVAPAV